MKNSIVIGSSNINSSRNVHGDISYNQDTSSMMVFNEHTHTWTELANKPQPIITQDALDKILKDHTQHLFDFLRIKQLDVNYDEFEEYLKSIQLIDKLKECGGGEISGYIR